MAFKVFLKMPVIAIWSIVALIIMDTYQRKALLSEAKKLLLSV
jgi:hypothetical protein